jgi:hypothetical protein
MSHTLTTQGGNMSFFRRIANSRVATDFAYATVFNTVNQVMAGGETRTEPGTGPEVRNQSGLPVRPTRPSPGALLSDAMFAAGNALSSPPPTTLPTARRADPVWAHTTLRAQTVVAATASPIPAVPFRPMPQVPNPVQVPFAALNANPQPDLNPAPPLPIPVHAPFAALRANPARDLDAERRRYIHG